MQIIVLGMHRSGTSAVARLLNLMGAYFGGENISTGASAENEKGFWERLDVRALNDSMLHNANCDWDRIAELDLDAIPEDFLNAYRRTARDIVLNLDAHRPWFIKEPRLCILLPLWRGALELPFCVHVFRHPLEVARSLKARNGIPIKVGLALWEAYNTKAIESSSDLPRLFVSYSELLSSPEPVVNQLRETMSSASGYDFRSPSAVELAGSLDNSLRHQRHEVDGIEDSPSKSQLALYELLTEAVATGATTTPRLPRSCLNALRRFESSGEHLAARMRRSNARQRANDHDTDPRLALKSMELDQALKAVSEKSTAISNAAKSNAKLTEELTKKNTDLALKNDALKRLTADVDNRRNVLAKRDERIRDITVELERRAAALAAKEDDLGELRERVTRLQASFSAKDAEVKDLIREVATLSAASEVKDDSLTRTQAELADIQTAAAAKDDSLARLQAELAEAKTAAAAKDDSLARLQAELAEAKTAAAAKDDSLARLQAELAEAKTAAAAKDDSLARLQAELAEAKTAAAAKDDSLARLQAELADAKTAAAAKDDSLTRLHTGLAEAKAASTAKDDRFARLATEFADVQAELGSKVEVAQRLSAKMQEYETRTAINNEAIERLTSNAKQRQQQISSLEHTVRRLTAESRHLRSELGAKNQSLAAKSVTVTRLRDELSQLRNRTERAVKRITNESVKIADENRNLKRQGELAAGDTARVKAEVDELRGRHRDLTTAVDAVLRSRRWRVGNFLLSLPYRLLFRRVPPMATDTIKKISEIETTVQPNHH